LPLEEKIKCLIKDEDVLKLEQDIAKYEKDLFSTTLSRIIRVINYNYIKDFYMIELLALNQVH